MVSLPDDVLYEIFRLEFLARPVKGPLFISHCCRRWRVIALNSPLLWSHIYISWPKPQNLERLQAWLERSQTCSLDIHIYQWRGLDMKACRRHLNACVEKLIPHARRWKTLSLQLESLDSPKGIKALIHSQRRLQKLQKLSISSSAMDAKTQLPILLSEKPNLQSLQITLVDSTWWWTTIPFRNSLRRLTILRNDEPYIPLGVFYTILCDFPLLEALAISATFRPKLVSQERRVITAANLKTLRMGPLDNSRLPFLRRLITPNLIHLRSAIDFSIIPDLLLLDNFPFQTLKTVCLVSRSHILDFPFSDQIVSFLSQLTSLRRLKLAHCTFDGRSSLLQYLAAVCPSMETLTLKSCTGEAMVSGLRELLEARKRKGSAVQKIVTLTMIYPGTALSEEDKLWFSMSTNHFSVEEFESS